MSPLALIQLAVASNGYQDVLTTLHDAEMLYGVYQAAKKAGKFSVAVLAKDGTLQPVVAAAERTIILLNKLLADKTQGPAILALIETL